VRRVSVIVPTYNRLPMLRQALASIRELEAANPDVEFEIVVGDNGLDDENRKACEEFGGVYAPAPGRGAAYARNAAMRAATAELIAFLDDDDAWLPGHVRPHLDFLDTHPEYDAVFGQAIYADPELRPTGEPWPEEHPGRGDDLTRRMLSGLFPQIGTVVARRSVIDQIGYFDTKLIGGQDLDWLLRLAGRHKLGFVPASCILFRGRVGGTSDALQRMRIGFDFRVFMRHGLPNALRLWKTPIGFIRAYHASLIHYYYYFHRKAIWFAEHGSLGETLEALVTPALYLPVLVAADLVRPTPLRKAIIRKMLQRPQAVS